MIDFSQVTNITLGGTEVTQIEDSLGTVLWTSVKPDYFYVEDRSGSSNTLYIQKSNSNAPTLTVYTSTDLNTWQTNGTTSASTPVAFTIPANGKLYVKCIANAWGTVSSNYTYFNKMYTRGNFAVGGNIMSLLYGDDFANQTTLEYDYSFYSLFFQTRILIDASDLELPATTLANYCYNNMFYGCDGLAAAPATLPATTLKYSCYNGMFQGCTGLTAAPALPATTLTSLCYCNMFKGCTSLTAAPALPATELVTSCYNGMFQGCTGLTAAPELPATTLANNCYQQMFYNCSSLNEVTTYATDISATGCISYWLSGVANSGDFYNLGEAVYLADNASGIPTGWTEHLPASTDYFYLEDRSGSDNTLSILKNNSSAIDITVYTSTDLNNWTLLGTTSTTALTATVPANGKLYVKATTDRWGMNIYQNNISASGNFAVGGNIMSLLYGDSFGNKTTVSIYALLSLFSDTTTLVDASELELPATTLAKGCYQSMFYGCTSLTAPPALPATTLADECYSYMFDGCTSLTAAPALLATTLATGCYYYMFDGCTSLTAAPALPVTTLADNCYQGMFQGCTSLTAAPALPATELVTRCYSNMFNGCTSLTAAPALPATSLADYCYNGMFYRCTALTQTPTLPATTLVEGCYQQMFYNCRRVNKIISYAADISADRCLNNWLSNVASSGNFYNLGGASYPSGTSGIPTRWTIRTSI